MRDRIVILSDVHAFNRNLGRDFSVIVNNQRNSSSRDDWVQLVSKIDKFSDGMFLSAQLDKIDISSDHCPGYTFGIGDADIAEVQDTVEPAIA